MIEHQRFLYQAYAGDLHSTDGPVTETNDTPEQWQVQFDLLENDELLYNEYSDAIVWLIDDNTPEQWQVQFDLLENDELFTEVDYSNFIWLNSSLPEGDMPDQFESYYIDQTEEYEPKYQFDDYSLAGVALFTDLPALLEQYFDIHKSIIPFFPGQITRPGGYISTGEVGSSESIASGYIYYVPFSLPYPMCITEIGVLIATANYTGQGRVGLYDNSFGVPNELIYQNILNLNSVGYRSVLGRVYLSAGLYWAALLVDSATNLYSVSSGATILGKTSSSEINKVESAIQIRNWADGLPSIAGEVVYFTGSSPCMRMKIAG